MRRVRASDDERSRPLPGDDMLARATGSLTHAITIDGPASAVWPWLVQMGAGTRAGWYSYDVLDNGRQPSASRVVPSLQQIRVGTIFPAGPGITEGFVVVALDPGRSLVLGWPNADGSLMVTWAFVLVPQDNTTRLIVRVRGGQGYRFHGLPPWLSTRVIRAVHYVMQRKQLLGIARRVESTDSFLDAFVPTYDVVERHHVRVRAPADVALRTATDSDLFRSPIVRAIVKGRELLLGSEPDTSTRPVGLLAMASSIGWGKLAELSGREIVMGAVTQPWKANVTFRALPPSAFAAFEGPGYVKIAWTLRADPVSSTESVFRSETRAVATDESARARFRRYWPLVSPGIVLIRWIMLRQVKRQAERRFR